MKVTFDGDEQNLTLFEAAIWIGGKGWNLSDEQTAAVFKGGVAELFQTLASGRLSANGIRRETQLREDIPNAYWERAEELPEPSEKKHSVSFIEDNPPDPDGSGFGGTLTPYGDGTPRWSDIRIDGHAIRSIYPFGWRKRRLTPEESQARDEIIGRAMRGELTPAEADDEALRRIGEPIETRPDPSHFRPDCEPWWTLTMALAWIVRRDFDVVCCYWNEYRQVWWIWRRSAVGIGTPSEQKGYVAEPQGHLHIPESLVDLYVETTDRESGQPAVGLGEAEKELTAYAVSIADRTPIPDYEWIDVGLGDAFQRFSGEPWVRSEDVMALWKAPGHDGKERRPPRRPREPRDAALAALKEIYPDSGGDPGTERRKDVLQRVNAVLRKRGGYPIQRDTLRRAINEILGRN
jgi:hypothetical protein